MSKVGFSVIIKAVVLAPFAFVQLILWLYLTTESAKLWFSSAMSFEQELGENWMLIQIAYFIWTNQLIKLLNNNNDKSTIKNNPSE